MASSPSKPSFSRGRKWGIAFNVALIIVAALAIVVMLNYLSGRYSRRFYLSSRTQVKLSPRTLSVLRALTNQVQVTIYFDKDAKLFSDVSDLLREYHAQNPKVKVAVVDYYREPVAAEEIKARYHLGSSTNRNLVIFECGGKKQVVSDKELAQFKLEQDLTQTNLTFMRKLVAFNGELNFTAAILAVANPRSFKAYFLQGHGEHPLYETELKNPVGYASFGEMLRRNDIEPTNLPDAYLLGTNPVPLDCTLLVIPGPRVAIPESELEKIEQYLNQGGRLLAMFNFLSTNQPTGLERILAKWGVNVSPGVVRDPNLTPPENPLVMVVQNFSTQSPITQPLVGSLMELLLPRSVSRIEPPASAATDLPQVTELVLSTGDAMLSGDASGPHTNSMMVAVERNSPKGVVTERGATRMVIAGDSFFLDNELINAGMNRDFGDLAVNWLLERKDLLAGVGPRPVEEYGLLLDRKQAQAVEWILLAGVPGSVLLLGCLVWLRRRK